MLSLKYIRIRKERPAEQCLSTIWQQACADFGIPCVLIYLDGGSGYISASLKHLRNLDFPEQGLPQLHEKLRQNQLIFAGTTQGYWKHSDYYHTFDRIPQAVAKEAAEAIFTALNGYLHPEPKPENKIDGTASQPTAKETPT